jgi:DNA-binding response OmpR family regulator
MKILLAASSNTLKKLINKSLESRGDEVIIANSEEEIMNSVFYDKPTIILLQGTLWKESGFEVCLSIQNVTQTPVIIFSSGKEIQEKYIKYHSSDFLEIPFSPEKLYDKIDLLVQNRKTILIVEDSEMIRKSLTKSLKEKGFDIIEAKDGVEALEKLKEEYIDVILSDVEMPRMNGYELCRKVKRDSDTSYIPVILTSTLSSGLFIDRGFQAGADEYLPKPIKINQLITSINNIFSDIDNVNRGNILFIDEKEFLFEQFKPPLINQGFIVYNVKKIAEAIPTINKKEIDILIILDEMLDLLGFNFVKKLNALEKIVIILLNRSSRKKIAKLKAANILFYIAKPFTPEKLVGIVERAVTDTNRNKELEAVKSYISEAALASARQIAKNKVKKNELRAEERTLTLLFTDIKGFSTLCENLETPEIVGFLNNYFDIMANILKQNGALIDKYIGDAIMALFDPLKDKDAHFNAVNAALEMQEALTEFNRERIKNNEEPVFMRIGVNTGQVIWGDVGSIYDRRDTTVIGDPVNIASRLEGANKQFGTKIMISENTYHFVKDNIEVRELDLIRVKGKLEPTRVYEVLAKKGELSKEKAEVVHNFHQGLMLYRNREFKESLKYFLMALELDKADNPSKTYIKRAKIFIKSPPSENWDGVYTMKTK